MTRHDGVRTLEDIRSRCVINDETGCWIWRGAYSRKRSGHGQPIGRVWLPTTRNAQAAPRAAWILAGKPLPAQHVVWRSCADSRCINPAHGAAGPRTAMHAAIVADGRLRGDMARAATNRRNCATQLLPVDLVRAAEAMFAAGAMQKTVRRDLHISADSARRIRLGVHPHCSAAQRVVPAASVFALGAARARQANHSASA